MIKLLGASLIIFASLKWGYDSILMLKRRTDLLSEFIASLNIMSGEICVSMVPMSDVLERLSVSGGQFVRPFYKKVLNSMERLGAESFSDIWKDGISELCLLNENEKKIILDMGEVLGRFDINKQGETIHYAEIRLTKALEDAMEKRKSDTKVYGAFSAAAGLLTVIILI